MVYIADVTGFGILVYNNELDIAWRFENKLTYPNPDYGTFTIAGESFDLMDGIFGLALTPKGIHNLSIFLVVNLIEIFLIIATRITESSAFLPCTCKFVRESRSVVCTGSSKRC